METLVIQQVDPAVIVCPPQIRKSFSEESIREMAQSIQAVGILQPIRVRQDGQHLVAEDGERRIRAALELGRKTVPVLVVNEAADAAGIIQRQLVANAQREGLNAVEQADAIERLMKESGCTAAAVATKIGKSPATISKLLSLLTLPADMKEKIAAGEIGLREGHRISRSNAETPAAPMSDGKRHRKPKQTAILDAMRKVVVEGVDSTMEAFVNTLETLLSRCKTARRQGVELPTFLAMLRDQADS